MHEKVKAQIAHIDSEDADNPEGWTDGVLEFVTQGEYVLVQIIIGDMCAAARLPRAKYPKLLAIEDTFKIIHCTTCNAEIAVDGNTVYSIDCDCGAEISKAEADAQ